MKHLILLLAIALAGCSTVPKNETINIDCAFGPGANPDQCTGTAIRKHGKPKRFVKITPDMEYAWNGCFYNCVFEQKNDDIIMCQKRCTTAEGLAPFSRWKIN